MRDDGKLVIHNYGAGGVGFQASWYVQLMLLHFVIPGTHVISYRGLARYAVDLLPERARM
jgi:D-amino-acid oxidase